MIVWKVAGTESRLFGTITGNAEQTLGGDDKLRRVWECTFRKVQDETRKLPLELSLLLTGTLSY